MKTLICTACGRFTSRYKNCCPYCKKDTLVILDSFNKSALEAHKLIARAGISACSPWQGFLFMLALAGSLVAYGYLWMYPGSFDKAIQANSKLISSVPWAATLH